jgi:hypothetical protein
MPAGRTFLSAKIPEVGIEGILVAASLGSFDDDANCVGIIGIARRELQGIDKRAIVSVIPF